MNWEKCTLRNYGCVLLNNIENIEYLFTAHDCTGSFNFLRDNPLLLAGCTRGHGGRDCLLFKLLRTGICTQVFVRRRRSRGNGSSCYEW